MKFGELFKKTRNDLCLSQVDMARALKTSQSLVSRIENDLLTPGADLLVRLARLADGHSTRSSTRVASFIWGTD